MPLDLGKRRNKKSPGTAVTVTRPTNFKHPNFTNTAATGNAEAGLHTSLLANGISTVPLHPGSKAAAIPKGFDYREPTTEVNARRWDRGQGRQYEGIGVLCGAVSRLICFDEDLSSCDEGFRKLVEAQAPGLLARLFQQRTPRGGKHYVARYDGPIKGSQKLSYTADKEGVFETKGDGGYFCTSKSGYEHIDGPALPELVSISDDELEILYSAGRSHDELAAQDYQEPTVPGEAAGGRPGDDFNERASWDDVLLPHGWTRGHASDTWTRPGKSDGSTSASTATRSDAGVELLHVFTTNAPPLEADIGKSYSKFAACTVLNHGGDYKAASKALREAGWGDQSVGPAGHVGNGPVSDDGRSLTNWRADGTPFQPKEAVAGVHEVTGGMPYGTIGPETLLLFVQEKSGVLSFISSPAQLERWLRDIFEKIAWKDKHGCMSMTVLYEAFRALGSPTIRHRGIETNPHFPKHIPGFYYLYEESADGGDGVMFERLLDMFNPETSIDRLLIKLAAATLYWNGGGGSRPAFMISSDYLWGSGKSTLAKMLCRLHGVPPLSFQPEDKLETIAKRLLSPEASNRRVYTLDNLKSNRFSSAGIEGLVTSEYVSGHRMYNGEGTRLNYFTCFITCNDPQLSTDIAQRSVTIKLGNLDGEDGGGVSRRSTSWERDVCDFIDTNRNAIVNDIGAFLRGDKAVIEQPSRWAAWEGEVLACLPNANEVQAVILERQATYDADARDAHELEDHFISRVMRAGFQLDRECVHVVTQKANEWTKDLFDGRYRETAGQLVGRWQRHLRRLRPNPSNKHGRGFIVGDAGNVRYDLLKKLGFQR